jgi:hypothetical protein
MRLLDWLLEVALRTPGPILPVHWDMPLEELDSCYQYRSAEADISAD